MRSWHSWGSSRGISVPWSPRGTWSSVTGLGLPGAGRSGTVYGGGTRVPHGIDARYVAEWLAGQAAGGDIEYADGQFS